MRRRRLGGTSVEVTELGFGGAPIGNLYSAITDSQAYAAVSAAWEGGIRYFDTAPHYGVGVSERRLGRVLRELPRDEFVISTKVGRLLRPNPHPAGQDQEGFDIPDDVIRVFDYSAEGVRRSLDESRERLGLDKIDIALVHDPDDHLQQAAEESIPALCELRDHGVIGAVGLGMNYVDPLLGFVTRDYQAGVGIDVILVAGRWTLLDRSARRLLDACAERGISVISAAPFNSGLLANPEPPDSGTFNYAPASAELLDRARQFAVVAREHGSQLPQAAVRFPLRHPAVASVLAGMKSAEEAATNCGLITDDLDRAAWQALDALPPAIVWVSSSWGVQTVRGQRQTAAVADRPEIPSALLRRLDTVLKRFPDCRSEEAWIGIRWRVRNATVAHVFGGEDQRFRITFRAEPEEVTAFEHLGEPYFRAEWGHNVVGMIIDSQTDWRELKELLTDSYCLQAPAKLAAQVNRPG